MKDEDNGEEYSPYGEPFGEPVDCDSCGVEGLHYIWLV